MVCQHREMKMSTCPNCGGDLQSEENFCPACGAQTNITVEPTFEVRLSAQGKTAGPFSEETVRTMIRKGSLSHVDSVRRDAEAAWVPLLQSEFSKDMVDHLSIQRLASTTCPQCASTMVAKIKYPKGAIILVILGLVLTPCFFVGTPVWIVGWIWMVRSRATHFVCPRCKYSAN